MHAGEGVGPFDPKMDTTTTQTRIGRQNATSKGGNNNNNNKTTKTQIECGALQQTQSCKGVMIQLGLDHVGLRHMAHDR